MLNHYPAWKNALVVIVTLLGFLLALPNLYGEDPAIQITKKNASTLAPAVVTQATDALKKADIAYISSGTEDGHGVIRFGDTEHQLKAMDVVSQALGDDYSVAVNLAPRTPQWLRDMGLKPMNRGLDLRGGVHFLLQVDLKAAVDQAIDNDRKDIQTSLREKRIRYMSVDRDGDGLRIQFRSQEDLDKAKDLLLRTMTALSITEAEGTSLPVLVVRPSEQTIRSIKDTAVEQNIVALRKRVNELGVAEPIVQRQGQGRIVVELPGIQDTARAKEKLGDTATIEFRLVYTQGNAYQAEQTGHIPLGARLYKTSDGRPVLLKREVIVAGPQIKDAQSGFDQQSGGPEVSVTLDSAGGAKMAETTRENLNKPMAVVYIENRTDTRMVDGKPVKVHHKIEKVINIANIAGLFSSRFQITGLSREEAKSLALVLRTPLAAPIDIIAQHTVGPSLGKDNIKQGFASVVLGFLLVVGFMAVYYKVFGLIADIALFMNVVLTVALLSLLQATLTLPGIAGIVLTVGMAVDANVLIYERIREELRNGNSPQAAIHAGYERALGTIADSNITTLIAGIVLFSFGTGPVKGFAVTLTLGILTSMFTAIMGSRAIVNKLFGARKLSSLPV